MTRPAASPLLAAAAAAAALALALAAAPASAHVANLTFRYQEGGDCPEDSLSCIRVEGGPGTEANIRDDAAALHFEGVHAVEIRIENGGQLDHNLTFEPDTPIANYSIDDAIEPGESVTFNFTTVEDVPPGSYDFYGGMPGHRDAGEEGTLEIEAGPEPEPEQSEVVEDVIGVPGPGPLAALAALAAALATRRVR